MKEQSVRVIICHLEYLKIHHWVFVLHCTKRDKTKAKQVNEDYYLSGHNKTLQLVSTSPRLVSNLFSMAYKRAGKMVCCFGRKRKRRVKASSMLARTLKVLIEQHSYFE